MVRRGVTAVLDDPIYAPGPTPETVDAVMGAYQELGVRATVTIYQPDKPEHEWFPYLSDLLEPEVLARFETDRPPSADDIISTYRDFIERWHGAANGRLRCAVSPSAPQRATERYLLDLHALAAEHDLPFVVHVYESKVQRVAEQLLHRTVTRAIPPRARRARLAHVRRTRGVDRRRGHRRPGRDWRDRRALALGQSPLRQRSAAVPPPARCGRADRAVHR